MGFVRNLHFIFAGEWSYYVNDHLGSTRVILNESGNVKQFYDYDPFGKTLRESIAGTEKAKYRFTGKELDEEEVYTNRGLDWYYFGARFYDPNIGRYLTPDPLETNSPSITPYHYAANNPLRFIDVNGDSIWINYGEDQRLLYTAGMSYTGNNQFVTSIINALNTMNSTQNGQILLSSLMGSSNNINVLNQVPSEQGAHMQFLANSSGGGDLSAENITNMSAMTGVQKVSHELFHSYQNELGFGGPSVNNEVEAFLFQAGIAYALNDPITTVKCPPSLRHDLCSLG